MSLLDEPQCLRCGSALPVRGLWEFARVHDKHGLNLLTGSGLLRGKIGIECPNCGARFRVVQTRIRILFALVWVIFLGTAASLEDWTSHHIPVFQQRPLAVLMVLVSVLVMFLLLRIYTPRLARVRRLRDGEQLTFPLACGVSLVARTPR